MKEEFLKKTSAKRPPRDQWLVEEKNFFKEFFKIFAKTQIKSAVVK